jgi:kynurenine formamidase
MAELPTYDELPEASDGGRSAWGVFGPDDVLGTINLLTPERIAAASRLVRRGAMFPLDAPVGAFNPALIASRGAPRHRVLHQSGSIGFDDVMDNFFPQGSSQWDSLGHVAYAPNQFYNGTHEDDITAGRRNTIDYWVRHGLAGRAVLLDLVRTRADAGRPYDPWRGEPFSVEDLELARTRAGVELQTGDFLLLYTGYVEWYVSLPLEERRKHSGDRSVTAGLEPSEEMCRYLWDHHVAAVAADNASVEVHPLRFGKGVPATSTLHRMLIGQFGMAIGELWWLKDLADDCASDGIYEMFLVSCPLNIPGGIGSPPNAVAIK